ncbi:C40 family peptidase [Thermoflavimicrobium daqui]|uniref:Uncharacterized protein n=1 Tax=Thermoflavimicrobium daqui TaxID=2137476 RepID=A0A364K8D7_9BACL|nr:LysM peptidoglycan-binding domain-containing C40 family peptidase [Thermoflavimicrobium daqui]RAL26566.1 hypothetical protein DL897_00500 [Thermoflavimicrobium daqui]
MKKKCILALGTLIVTSFLSVGQAFAATYTVQKGDTLYSISKKYNTSVSELQKLNKLNSTTIRVGQKLTVPDQKGSNGSSSSQSSWSVKADKVINEAKKHVGKKYRYGGTGPSSFDCSGFTQYVYKNSIGYSLPRVSSDQAKRGKSTGKSLSNLRKGDLMVFKENGRVFHVAIYMGNGKMIHAASSKTGVSIADVNNVYWKPRFAEGRRLF